MIKSQGTGQKDMQNKLYPILFMNVYLYSYRHTMCIYMYVPIDISFIRMHGK